VKNARKNSNAVKKLIYISIDAIINYKRLYKKTERATTMRTAFRNKTALFHQSQTTLTSTTSDPYPLKTFISKTLQKIQKTTKRRSNLPLICQ
jgi:hypothetical protein